MYTSSYPLLLVIHVLYELPTYPLLSVRSPPHLPPVSPWMRIATARGTRVSPSEAVIYFSPTLTAISPYHINTKTQLCQKTKSVYLGGPHCLTCNSELKGLSQCKDLTC